MDKAKTNARTTIKKSANVNANINDGPSSGLSVHHISVHRAHLSGASSPTSGLQILYGPQEKKTRIIRRQSAVDARPKMQDEAEDPDPQSDRHSAKMVKLGVTAGLLLASIIGLWIWPETGAQRAIRWNDIGPEWLTDITPTSARRASGLVGIDTTRSLEEQFIEDLTRRAVTILRQEAHDIAD